MMRISIWALVVVAMTATAIQSTGAACQTADGMIENFMSLYPTGGPAARFEGETGDQVEQKLPAGRDADEVVFLYSGHGPVTGARGRYMYLLLDPADCILAHGWIDGEAYDRAVPAQ